MYVATVTMCKITSNNSVPLLVGFLVVRKYVLFASFERSLFRSIVTMSRDFGDLSLLVSNPDVNREFLLIILKY